MKGDRTKLRLLVIGALLCVATLMAMAWCVTKTVAWVRELPNRINIQIDGDAIGVAITEAIRSELQSENSQSQLNAIECLSAGISETPESQTWIQDEYGEEISALTGSSDPEVAHAAARLVENLKRNRPSDPDR